MGRERGEEGGREGGGGGGEKQREREVILDHVCGRVIWRTVLDVARSRGQCSFFSPSCQRVVGKGREAWPRHELWRAVQVLVLLYGQQ